MKGSPLTAVVEATEGDTEAEILAAHAEQLAAVVDAVGVAPAAEAAGLATDRLTAIVDGDADSAGGLDLQAAATVLALVDGAPSATAIVDAALDDLLFGMTAGVLNVDVVAGEVSLDLEPREVQGMLEGRHPLTLREFVALQAAILGRSD